MTQLAVPNAPRKIDPRRERSSDDLRQSQGLLVASPVSRETARLIFQPISNALGDLARDNCILCDAANCNGFKINNDIMCKKRSDLVTHRNNMVCYGCGGPHPKPKCIFRPGFKRPEVPVGVGRCFTCLLPQHAQCGLSFHSGEAGLSGGSQSQSTCTQRGDQVFALLSTFYWSRNEHHERFMTFHGAHVAEINPHHTDTHPVGGNYGFPRYWTWLWVISPIGHSVRHLDVVLSFMLNQRMVFV